MRQRNIERILSKVGGLDDDRGNLDRIRVAFTLEEVPAHTFDLTTALVKLSASVSQVLVSHRRELIYTRLPTRSAKRTEFSPTISTSLVAHSSYYYTKAKRTKDVPI